MSKPGVASLPDRVIRKAKQLDTIKRVMHSSPVNAVQPVFIPWNPARSLSGQSMRSEAGALDRMQSI
jgi:hypothetical protein